MATAPSRATFLASVPGSAFLAAPTDVIDAALTEAAARTSGLFQSDQQTELAVMYRAAILLAEHPSGEPMRLADPGRVLTWQRQLDSLIRAGFLGVRVF